MANALESSLGKRKRSSAAENDEASETDPQDGSLPPEHAMAIDALNAYLEEKKRRGEKVVLHFVKDLVGETRPLQTRVLELSNGQRLCELNEVALGEKVVSKDAYNVRLKRISSTQRLQWKKYRLMEEAIYQWEQGRTTVSAEAEEVEVVEEEEAAEAAEAGEAAESEETEEHDTAEEHEEEEAADVADAAGASMATSTSSEPVEVPVPAPAPAPALAASTALVATQPAQATKNECAICLDPLEQRYVLPSCGHTSTCMSCIETIIRENPRRDKRTCPECRTVMRGQHFRVFGF